MEYNSFWQIDGLYRIWRAGLPGVGPGEKFRLVDFDDIGVYVQFLHDTEWARDAGDFILCIPWGSVMAARQTTESTETESPA